MFLGKKDGADRNWPRETYLLATCRLALKDGSIFMNILESVPIFSLRYNNRYNNQIYHLKISLEIRRSLENSKIRIENIYTDYGINT